MLRIQKPVAILRQRCLLRPQVVLFGSASTPRIQLACGLRLKEKQTRQRPKCFGSFQVCMAVTSAGHSSFVEHFNPCRLPGASD